MEIDIYGLPRLDNSAAGSSSFDADQTAPLVGFYRDAGKLVVIDALGAVEDVTERAISALEPYAD